MTPFEKVSSFFKNFILASKRKSVALKCKKIIMIIEIPKGTSEKKVKSILNRRKSRRKLAKKSVDAFFGKLPELEDGLTTQKKQRREWS